jgi:hypothetical protein
VPEAVRADGRGSAGHGQSHVAIGASLPLPRISNARPGTEVRDVGALELDADGLEFERCVEGLLAHRRPDRRSPASCRVHDERLVVDLAGPSL